jgi:hypothetical protein
MTATELGDLVNAAFDDVHFVDTIRERLRTAVAAVIGVDTADADVRAGRMAAEQLATVLVAQRRAAGHERAPHADRPRGAHPSTAVEDVELRARAFRAMAGVRV